LSMSSSLSLSLSLSLPSLTSSFPTHLGSIPGTTITR
jgi:hypothetical protein